MWGVECVGGWRVRGCGVCGGVESEGVWSVWGVESEGGWSVGGCVLVHSTASSEVRGTLRQ